MKSILFVAAAWLLMFASTNARTASDPTGTSNPIANAPPNPSGPTINGGSSSFYNSIQGDTLNFRLVASNPSGPAPKTSDFTLLVNDIPQPATIIKVTEGNFILQWIARLPRDYPAAGSLLQSLSVRYSPASTAVHLGFVDVAEWQGMIAGMRMGSPTNPEAYYDIRSHYNGRNIDPKPLVTLNGVSTYYRGPKAIPLLTRGGGDSGIKARIVAESRYPLFKFTDSTSAPDLQDVADVSEFPDMGTWYRNFSSKQLLIKDPTNTSVTPGGLQFASFPEPDPRNDFNMVPFLVNYLEDNRERSLVETAVRYVDSFPGRSIYWFVFYGDSRIRVRSDRLDLPLYSEIMPYSAGTLDYPGLPISFAEFSAYHRIPSPLLMATDQWHKIVLKLGPDALGTSTGVQLQVGSGEDGDGVPQSGFELMVKNASGPSTLGFPADGKLSIDTSSPIFKSLISPNGLTLFMKRSAGVQQRHRIRLNLKPKPSYGSQELASVAQLEILPVEVVPDYNRDGKIDDNDRGKVTTQNPFHWWINDDNDLTTAERGNALQDIPNQIRSTGTGPVDDRDCGDLAVDGMGDLIDFFPLHLDLERVLEIFPESEYKYVLKHEDEALKFYEYPTCVVDGSEEGKEPNRHVIDVGTGRGLAAKALKLASLQGSELSANMLTNLKEGRGVLVVEGAKKTAKPLVLEILKKSDNSSIAKVDFPIRIADVEEMYRHVNMRNVTDGSGGHPTQTGEPSGYPDDLTNGKYVAFVHGYFVSGEVARGSNSNIFKRFHQLGSKARYIGISWYGDPPNPGINLALPPDYHLAVDNGLKTGIVAKVRLNFTQGSSLTVLAHSLGNSVVGSAIANHGLEVEQYYVINGAIALQAYDSSQTSNSSAHPDMKRNMTEDDWKPFYDHGNGEQQRLFASNWHELFAATSADKRNKLTWKDLFAKPELLRVAYNFYSPSDEVVENPDETEEFGDFWNLVDAATAGRHAWVQQEIAKGGQHALAASAFHDNNGGWRFNNNPSANTPLETGYSKANLTNTGWRPYTVAEAAAEITNEDLKVVPYHLPFLYLALYDPAQGSATAGVSTNRYKLLGSGIPATSYAIAANRLDYLGDAGNFNMPADLKSPGGNSSWPVDSRQNNPTDWLHSDFNDVALQFLHPMYQKMIDLAELDNESN